MNNGSAVYDVWAHFPAEDPRKSSPDGVRAAGLRVDSTIGDDLSLSGKTTLHLKTLRGGERVVPLEFRATLAISDIRGEDGQPALLSK